MQHIKQQQAQAIDAYFRQHFDKVTHIAVAHTRYWTHNCNDEQIAMKVAEAKKDCLHFRNHLNAALFGGRNNVKRYPERCTLLLLATLEGSLVRTNEKLTLHYNFMIGNIPAQFGDKEFAGIFKDCWVNKAHQRDDIRFNKIVDEADLAGCTGYFLKEMDAGNIDVWDFENTQVL